MGKLHVRCGGGNKSKLETDLHPSETVERFALYSLASVLTLGAWRDEIWHDGPTS